MRTVGLVAALTAGVAQADFQSVLQDIVTKNAEKYHIGLGASVYLPGKLNNTAVSGPVSFEKDAPQVSLTERFIWGSITKISTGTAILRLQQEGKLKLTDTIPQYIDPAIAEFHKADPQAFPWQSSRDLWGPLVDKVTIHDLGAMRSGIPDFDTAKPYPPPPTDPLRETIYKNKDHDYLPQELMAVPWVATGNLSFYPGTKLFDYSSTNFMLLGLILAHFSGTDVWSEYDQSSFLPKEIKAQLPSIEYARTGCPSTVGRLHGYDRTSYNGQNSSELPGKDISDVHGVFAGWTASDYTSTLADAAHFAHLVYGPESPLLTEDSQKVMIPWDPIYGWATFNLGGQTGQKAPYKKAYGHIGATYGFDSMLSFHPELNATIAIASNMENDDQTHPSDTLCLVYTAVKNEVTGSKDVCHYTEKGYYGGLCNCTYHPAN